MVEKGFELDRLYAITDRALAGRSHAEIVEAVGRGGGRLVQLREKELSARDFYRQAKLSLERARATGVRLIINDRADIAKLLGADGLHLGQEDLAPEKARILLGENAII